VKFLPVCVNVTCCYNWEELELQQQFINMALRKVCIFSGVPKIYINEMRMKPNKHIHRQYHFLKAIRSNGY